MRKTVRGGEMGTDRSGPRQQVYFQGSTPEASALFSIPAARKSERERERERKGKDI